MNDHWTLNAIPDQQGRLAIVTGGNSGIGYEAGLALAGKNARVILAVRSVGCHPGFAATNLQTAGPQMEGSAFRTWMMKAGNALFAQRQDTGALPTLFAATAAEVNGGDYIGPAGGMRGHPQKVKSSAKSYAEALAKRLWTVSEELTGVVYNFEV